MTHDITIAVDAMGGDTGPAVCVPASIALLHAYPDLRMTMVGDQQAMAAWLSPFRTWFCDNSLAPEVVLRAGGQ